MNNLTKSLPRQLKSPVQAAPQQLPVVVPIGARQTGNSTLIQRLLDPRRENHTLNYFDNLDPKGTRVTDWVQA